MRRMGTYEGQRAALALVYSASDCDSPEGDEALSALDTEIREQWDERGV